MNLKFATLTILVVSTFILCNCDCGGGGGEETTDILDTVTDTSYPTPKIEFLDPTDGRSLTPTDDKDPNKPLIQYDVQIKVQNVEVGQRATLINASDTTQSSSGKSYTSNVKKDQSGKYIAVFTGVTFVNGANSLTATVKNLSGGEASKTIVVTAISEVSCTFVKPQNNDYLTTADDKDQDISNGFQYNVQLSCIGIEVNQTAKLFINGVEAAVSKAGVNSILFQDVTFAEGTNELTVDVSNLSGIKASVETISVVVNTGRCLIRIISPLDGSRYLVNGQGEKVILDKDKDAVGMQATLVAETAYEKMNTACGVGSKVNFTITTPNKVINTDSTVAEESGTNRLIASVDITFDEEALLNGELVTIEASVIQRAGEEERIGNALPVNVVVDSVPPSGEISIPLDGSLFNANMDADASKPGFQIMVQGFSSGVSSPQKLMLRMDAAINPDLPPITMDIGSDVFTPDGNFAFKSVTIPEGIHTLRLYLIDDSGNEFESQDITITVDTGIPFAQFFWPTNNSYLSMSDDEDNGKPNLQTTKFDIRTQNIQDGIVGKLIIKGGEYFEFTVHNNKAVFNEAVELPEGKLEMTVDVKNAGGLEAYVQPDPLIVNVDITPPVLAITDPLDNTTVDTNLINVTVKTIGLANGDKVYLKVNDVDIPSAEVEDGWATFTDVPLLADETLQPNIITAYSVDKAGNSSNKPSISVYVDTTVPALTFTAPEGGAVLTENDDKDSDLSNGFQYDIKVKAENLPVGTIGKLYIKEVGEYGSPVESLPATDIGGGFVEMVFENITLPEGSISLRAEANNAVGKLGVAEIDLLVSTGRFIISIVDPADGRYLNSSDDKSPPASDGVQYDVKASTDAPDGTDCTLSVKQTNIAVFNAQASGGNITFEDVTFSEGSSQIWVSCDSGVKNGLSAKYTVYVDTVNPSISFVAPSNDQIFNLSDEDKFPGPGFGIDITVKGGDGPESLEDDSDVTLTVVRAQSTEVLTGKVKSNSYTFTGVKVTDVAGSDWTDTTLKVKAKDRAGNESDEVEIIIHIDRKAPNVSITFPVADKLGIQNDYDHLQQGLQTQIKAQITDATPGKPVSIIVTGATSISDEKTLTSATELITFPNSGEFYTLNDGSNVVNVSTQDAAGNTGSAVRTYDVNTTRPEIELFDKNFAKLNDTTNYVWNKSWDRSEAEPGFQGFFFVQTKGLKNDSEIRLCSDNYGSATELCQDGSGLYRVIAKGRIVVNGPVGSVTFGQVSMPEGDHKVFAEAQDDYGNKGSSIVANIKIDSVPPTVQDIVISNNQSSNDVAPNIMLGLSEDQDTNTSGILSSFEITTSGVEDGQKVYLMKDGERITGVEGTVTNSSAVISYNIPDGSYTFSVEAVDAAGNVSESSPVLAVLADSIPPVISFKSPPEFVNPNWLTQLTCVYNCIYESSTLKLDVVVSVSDNNPLVDQKVSLTREAIKTEITIDDSMGNDITFSAYPLLQGINNIKADLQDIVKNPAVQVSREFDVDTVAPSVAFVYPNTPNQGDPYIFLPADDLDSDLNNGLQTDKFAISISGVDSPSNVTIENRLVGVGSFNAVPNATAVVGSDNSNFQFNFAPYPTLYKGDREFRIKATDDKGNISYSSKVYANVNINVPAVGIEKWTADGVVDTGDELVDGAKFTKEDDFDPTAGVFKTTINVVSDVLSGAEARLWVNNVEIVPAVQLQGGKAAFTNIELNQYPSTNTLKASVTDPNSGITTTIELSNILADGDSPTVEFTNPLPDGNQLSIDGVYTSANDADNISLGLQFKPGEEIKIQTTGVEEGQVALLVCSGDSALGGDNSAIVQADGTATFANVIFYTAHSPYDCTVEVSDYVGNKADDPLHIQVYVDVLPPASVIPSVCIGETTDSSQDEEKEDPQCASLCQPNQEYCGREGDTLEPDKTRCECSRRMGIAKLFFTAPANDGDIASSGKVADYEIRWAEDTSALHNCQGFDWSTASSDGVEIGAIVDPGEIQTAIVRGLTIHKYYCFAVKAIDSVPSPGLPNSSTTSGYEKDRRIPFIIENIATETGSTYGSKININGDFDGDGYADPVAADFLYNSNTGRIYVYYADTNKPKLIINGGAASSYFGVSFTIGDFNGDGYDDIAVGAGRVYSNDGRVYIYLGSPNGLPTTTQNEPNEPDILPSSKIVPPPNTSKSLGSFFVIERLNINGDSNNGKPIDDIAVSYGSSYLVYLGSTSIPSSYNTNLKTGTNPDGYDLSFILPNQYLRILKNGTAGDIDRDGYADMIISHIGTNSSDYGNAYIIFGSSNISGDKDPSSEGILKIPGNAQTFGLGLLSTDYNGDSAYDLLVRSAGYNIFKYKGVADDKTQVLSDQTVSNSSYNWFGIYMSRAGDINLDDYQDVAFATNGSTDGSIKGFLIYTGSSSGLSSSPTIVVSKNEGNFGVNVSGYKKYDGDKFTDLLTVNRSESKLYIVR